MKNTPNENGDGAEKPASSAKFRYMKFARFVIASVFIAVTVVVIAAVTTMYQKAPGPKAGELSPVRMEVDQSAVDEQFEIRCSSTSGCTPASINLIGTLGNTTFPLYGMNFTCITTYNGDDGWSVGCTGSIPESVVSSIDDITCRPVLQNQTEADEAEVKISKEVLVCNDSLNCSFDCSGDNQDKYYSNPKFCNIFHRCVDKRLYTAPCGKGAYFSTQTCVCSNIDDVIKEIGCDKDGMRLNVENVKTLCTYSTGSYAGVFARCTFCNYKLR
uniref:Chitin-binding type-2 domain-containing protein n=1 Tax=Magallana gigas TaxID=29159 RepID=A0A8W8MKT4_MAGGI